jgi:hypothetical protein
LNATRPLVMRNRSNYWCYGDFLLLRNRRHFEELYRARVNEEIKKSKGQSK